MSRRVGYVYIMASRKHGTLYTGVTSDLVRRGWQHKQRSGSRFTARYGVSRLVYVEQFDSIVAAIQREKTIKGWPRVWKIRTIERTNPQWLDLWEEINR